LIRGLQRRGEDNRLHHYSNHVSINQNAMKEALEQHGGVGMDFVLHPLIHTSGPSELSTKCGSRVSGGKVWIKV
jgi:hypothetical protein